jgi:membrane-bound lytic murein transglycosylase D
MILIILNYMNKLIFLLSCALLLNLNVQAQGSRYKSDAEEQQPAKSASNITRITAPKLPTNYTLFEEKVPLELFDIKDRFDRELIVNTYMQGSTIQIIKQMKRWFPLIEQRLKENGIPDDFKYLAVAESALMPAKSGVGASGFWQFMKGTGPSYGLEINEYVDERYHVLKSTDAACAYLKDAYAKFNNWTAAAASYNCGMGGYNGAASSQGSYNFYNLWLPDETMRYIFRIMALKYILDNPERSGYSLGTADTYLPYKTQTINVNYTINSLVQFAMDNGTNYKSIKVLNPWLRDKSLPNKSGKNYQILIPAK